MPTLSDSSPLILLSRVGRLELLHHLFDEVVVPPAVVVEIAIEAGVRPGAAQVTSASWIRVEPPRRAPSLHGLPAALGAGESEVLALALEAMQPCLVVMDDGPGRRTARQRGVDVVGTAGLLVLAKEADILDAVGPALDDLLAAGLYLGAAARQSILTAAGEG